MTLEKVQKLFSYQHLPPHLQEVSKPFHELAVNIIIHTPANEEQTLALRKLWEAKNLIVFNAATKIRDT